MQLIPDGTRRRLIDAGGTPKVDHPPLVNLFNPCGVAIWLISQMAPDEPDILFGLIDYGFGAEYGTVRLSDLEAHVGPFGLGIQSDLYFHLKPEYPLSVYAAAARANHGGITTRSSALVAVVRQAMRLVCTEGRS